MKMMLLGRPKPITHSDALIEEHYKMENPSILLDRTLSESSTHKEVVKPSDINIKQLVR